jgi:hypothetical protein
MKCFRNVCAASLALVSGTDWDDDDEADFLRDVYGPSGPALTELDITTAFLLAGYTVRGIELEPCHQVWIVRLRRGTAPKIGDQDKFHRHVRDVLRNAKICLRKKCDLSTLQTGDRALVAFRWPIATGRRLPAMIQVR